MDPEATGRSYDKIARKWQELPNKSYGILQFEKAIQFTKIAAMLWTLAAEAKAA